MILRSARPTSGHEPEELAGPTTAGAAVRTSLTADDSPLL
jgi:hypothetical protein